MKIHIPYINNLKIDNFSQSKIVEILILLSILSVALFLRIWRIEKIPPIIGDELGYGAGVIKILKIGLIKYIVNIPFLPNPYHGPVSYYLILPFIYFLGPNIFSLRIGSALIGTLTVLVTYLFTKNFYSKLVALLASSLLTIFPSHVLLSRTAIGPWVLPPFFVISSIYMLHRFYRTGGRRNFYLFSFLCGLGVLSRLTFLFYLMPLVVLTKMINPFGKRQKFKKKMLFVSMLIFILTLYPFIIHGEALLSCIKNPPFRRGTNLLDWKTNLIEGVTERFPTFLRGLIWENNLFFPFFVVSFLFLLIKSGLKYPVECCKKDIFLILSILSTVIFLSTITISDFFPEDFNILAPFIAIGIGRTLSFGRRLNVLLFYVCVIATLILLFNNTYSNLGKIGEGEFYEYMEQLSDYVTELNPSLIITTDGHTSESLVWYLYANGIEKEIYTLSYQKEVIERMMVEGVDGIFVFRSPKYLEDINLEGRNLFAEFLNLSTRASVIISKDNEIRSREGEVLLTIYSFKK